MSDEYFGLGCSDGNCRILGRRGGMHTNGGCKCLRYDEDIDKVKKLIAVARAAERIAPWIPDLPDSIATKYSENVRAANLLREALKELKGE